MTSSLHSSESALPPLSPAPALPWSTWAAMLERLLAVQAAWNYELMLGTGVGYAMEPVLRRLPGGRGGDAYRAALARESRYFNAHPYLTAFAVGALARAELDGEQPARIERVRGAMCGPLGSLGDRLVWAGWLPFASALALLAFGLGAEPWAVVALFLLVYNAGHIGLRAWGLRMGWRSGLRVASALGHPVLRHGPQYITRAAVALAGVALPLVVRRLLVSLPGTIHAVLHAHRLTSAWGVHLGMTIIAAAVLALVLGRLHGRLEGWRAALVILAIFITYSVVR